MTRFANNREKYNVVHSIIILGWLLGLIVSPNVTTTNPEYVLGEEPPPDSAKDIKSAVSGAFKVVPEYNEERGRWADIAREDIARTTKRAFDGRTVGLYRKSDDLIPIILRHVDEERQNVGG